MVALGDGVQLTEALERLVLREAGGEEEAEEEMDHPRDTPAEPLPEEAPRPVAEVPGAEAPGAGVPAAEAPAEEVAEALEATDPDARVAVLVEAPAATQAPRPPAEAPPSPEEAAAIFEQAERRAQADNDRRAKVATGLKPAVRTCWQKQWSQGCPSDYTFAVEDPGWPKHLRRHGFCVLSGVLPEADREEILDGFWAEMAQVVPGLRRYDPSTWDFPGAASTGITRGYGVPQSDFAWAVRGHPQIRRVFELIYRTDQLVVSMDSVKLVGTGVQEPGSFWLHRDQLKDVAPYSVQSIYTFHDVGPLNDGTILIPDSHKEMHAWDEWQRSGRGAIIPMLRAHGRDRNNVRVPEELQEVFMNRAIKPFVPANGLILFCSRTIHASSPDAEARWLRERRSLEPPPEPPRPNRVAVSVSMCPRGRRSPQALFYKMTLVKSQCSTTHWADDEVLKGKAWGRDEGQVGAGKFKVLPTPGREHERQRLQLL